MTDREKKAKEFIVQSVKDDVDIAKVADAIQALEQQPCDEIHGSTYGGVSWGGTYKPQQPCEDCISRKDALDVIEKEKQGWEGSERYAIDECHTRITELPSVTPTRPKGKWKILDECANEGVYCSKCHKKIFKLEFSHTMKWRNFKYCPNCGADMRGDSE